jgi:hypothetical protein
MALIWSATNFRAKDIKALIKLHTHASHAEYAPPFPSFRTPPPLIDTSRPIAVKSFERRISPLVALGILSINTHKGIQYVHMHPTFRHGLRNALANGYVPLYAVLGMRGSEVLTDSSVVASRIRLACRMSRGRTMGPPSPRRVSRSW